MEREVKLYFLSVLCYFNVKTILSCELITFPMCKGLAYNTTKYPNFLGHQNGEVAGLEVHQFFPLVKVGCSPYLREYLCRLYAPECDPNYPDDPLKLPTYSLCQAAKSGCNSLINQYGFRWPESLECEQFLGKSFFFIF